MNHAKLKLDPRAGVALLFILNFTAFSVSKVFALVFLFLWSSLYAIGNRYTKVAVKFAFIFVLLILVEFFLLPKLPSVVAISFAVLLTYALKMLPIALFGYVFVKTTSLHELIAALRKMHFPESIITGLSITLRYFPAIKEDYLKTYDAMKLKKLSLGEKVNGLIITTIIRASMNVEELSQAATVRGIDNPIRKSSMVHVKFSLKDLVVCLVSFSYFAFICSKY